MDNKLIGKKLKNLRIKKDLTLEDLADRSSLSKGFLSQLERGLTSPALDTMHDILEALGTDFATFFKNSENNQKVYTEKDYAIKKSNGYTIEWLVLNAQKNDSEPIRLTLKNNSESEEVEPFDGEHFIYVLDGEVSISYGTETFNLKKGQTFYSLADKIVKIKNCLNKNSKVIWTTTPPFF